MYYMKFLQFIIGGLLMVLLIFKIINWSNSDVYLSFETSSNRDFYSLKDPQKLYITLCNVNLIKISNLFDIKGNENHYDQIMDNIHTYNQRHEDKLKDLYLQKLNRIYHHNSSDMIKSFTVDGKMLKSKDFSQVETNLGVCYSLGMNITNSNNKILHMVLDPEENKYLFPNNGLIGFNMIFTTREDEKISSTSPNQVFISPELQTMVRLVKNKDYVCQMKCRNGIINKFNSGCTSNCNRINIGLVNQAQKSSLYSKLLQYTMDMTTAEEEQQQSTADVLNFQLRAILRDGNRTAFQMIVKSSEDLVKAQKTTKITWNLVKRIQNNLTDIDMFKKSMKYRTNSERKCLSKIKQQLEPLDQVFQKSSDLWQEWILRNHQNPIVDDESTNQLRFELYLTEMFFYSKNFISPEKIINEINLKIKGVLDKQSDLLQTNPEIENEEKFCFHVEMELKFWLEQLHYHSSETKAILNTVERKMHRLIFDNKRLRLAVSSKLGNKLENNRLVSASVQIIHSKSDQIEVQSLHSTFNVTSELLSIIIETLTISLLVIVLFDYTPKRNNSSIEHNKKNVESKTQQDPLSRGNYDFNQSNSPKYTLCKLQDHLDVQGNGLFLNNSIEKRSKNDMIPSDDPKGTLCMQIQNTINNETNFIQPNLSRVAIKKYIYNQPSKLKDSEAHNYRQMFLYDKDYNFLQQPEEIEDDGSFSNSKKQLEII